MAVAAAVAVVAVVLQWSEKPRNMECAEAAKIGYEALKF